MTMREHACSVHSMGQVRQIELLGGRRWTMHRREDAARRCGEGRVAQHPETYPDLDELLLLLLLDDEDDEEDELDDEEEEVPSRLSALRSSSSARSANSGLCSRSCTPRTLLSGSVTTTRAALCKK